MVLPNYGTLYSEVQTRYGVGPRYTQAYLALWLQRLEQPATLTLQDILNAPPPAPMWFDYAMSTNWRGQTIADLLADRIPTNARRYLDVGSGFGGFLVAFAKRGFEVCGIEIDPQRIELARANCLDFNLNGCIFPISILEADLKARLGTFDVITCVDVIEHVLDAPQAIANMISLLNPDGILFLEIPNKHSLYFVARDGHFELFGITLLPRPEAIEYHSSFFDFNYDVGDYFTQTYYRSEFAKYGCRFDALISDKSMHDLPDAWRKVQAGYQRYRAEMQPKLSPALDRKLRTRFATFQIGLIWDLIRWSASKGSRQLFLQKYLANFWQIVVTNR